MKALILMTIFISFMNADVFKKSNGLSEFNVNSNAKIEVKQDIFKEESKKSKLTNETNFGKARECEMNAKTDEERRDCWTKTKTPKLSNTNYESAEKAFEGTEEIQKKLNFGKNLNNIDTSKFKDKLKKEDIQKLKYDLY